MDRTQLIKEYKKLSAFMEALKEASRPSNTSKSTIDPDVLQEFHIQHVAFLDRMKRSYEKRAEMIEKQMQKS